MGAEDFSFYLERVPGCLFWLGLARPGQTMPSLHNPAFDFNDDAIPLGIRMLLGVASEYLAGRSS